jgi:DNA polymerase III subunit delta'
MLFGDIIGQRDVKARLTQSVSENRISHALLLAGPPGSGSLPLAIAYARYICCTSRSEHDSCGHCSSCIKFSKLAHPDLHFSFPVVTRKSGEKPRSTDFLPEWRQALQANPYLTINQWLILLDAENKQGNIPVEECHDIIKKLSLKSYESGYKILIMWMPEYLEIIEEPPPSTLFILVAENPEQLLPTITSRTQLIRVHRIPDEEMKKALMEKAGLDEQKASGIVHIADGNYSEALALAESEGEDKIFSEVYLEWMRLCYAYPKMTARILEWVEEFAKAGREKQKAFLVYGMHIARECMILNYADASLGRLYGKELESYRKFAPFINRYNAEDLAEELNKAHYHLERNANAKILFMDLSFKIHSLLVRKEPSNAN